MYDRREDMPGGHHTTKRHPQEAVYIGQRLYRRLSANALTYLYLYRACPRFGKPTRVHTRLLACRHPAGCHIPGTFGCHADQQEGYPTLFGQKKLRRGGANPFIHTHQLLITVRAVRSNLGFC